MNATQYVPSLSLRILRFLVLLGLIFSAGSLVMILLAPTYFAYTLEVDLLLGEPMQFLLGEQTTYAERCRATVAGTIGQIPAIRFASGLAAGFGVLVSFLTFQILNLTARGALFSFTAANRIEWLAWLIPLGALCVSFGWPMWINQLPLSAPTNATYQIVPEVSNFDLGAVVLPFLGLHVLKDIIRSQAIANGSVG